MSVVGVVPLQNVTQNPRVFLALNSVTTTGTATSVSASVLAFMSGPGILNALIVNQTSGTFAIYDAQVNQSTNSTYYSGSISTAGSNLLVQYSLVTSGQAGVQLPAIVDVFIPFKNGLVFIGNNGAVNALVA